MCLKIIKKVKNKVMREYSELFKSNGNDIVGNLSFNNMVSVNGGRYKIENLFKYLKKNEFWL